MQPQPDEVDETDMSGGGSSTGTSFGGVVPASTAAGGGGGGGVVMPGKHTRSPLGRPVHSSPCGQTSSSPPTHRARQWPSRQTAVDGQAGSAFHTVQPVGAFSQTDGVAASHFRAPRLHWS